MCRSELSEDLATWTLPSSRTKTWREHVVPPPPLARDLIGDVPRVAGDFVFTTDGVKPVAGFTWLKTRVDALMLKLARQEAEAAGRDPNAVSIPAWRIHDLRRSCATGMAKIKIQPHIVEAVLNHVSGAKAGVAGIYNQYSYLPEKKAALERWAAQKRASR